MDTPLTRIEAVRLLSKIEEKGVTLRIVRRLDDIDSPTFQSEMCQLFGMLEFVEGDTWQVKGEFGSAKIRAANVVQVQLFDEANIMNGPGITVVWS